MAGIASITGSGWEAMQSLMAMARASQPRATTAVQRSMAADQDGDNDGDSSGDSDAASDGIRLNGVGGLLQSIETAVTSSLQHASSSGVDANQTVESAISQVLQRTESQKTNSAQSSQTQAADADADNDATAGSTAETDRTAREAFFQLLRDNGISPQQFRDDLMAAIRSSGELQLDRATAFQNVPAGLTVDTAA